MRIRVRTFALLRELATHQCVLDIGAGATVADAWDAMVETYPALDPYRDWVRAARNGAYAAWDTPLGDGDEVALLPPVSGGEGSRLVEGAIDVAALEARIVGLGHGAIVTFVGQARDHADDGRPVTGLEYEAYPEMAERVLAEIEFEAAARWHADVAVEHRVGSVPIGEAAVAIVVAAAHRSDAYEASRHVIEAIKARLPIWKRERFADGSEWKRPGA